jgi:hypothetical protein
MPQKKIPARYIGGHTVQLPAGLGPFYNIDGTRRTSLLLETGDTLMMPETEIIGQTYLFDPRGQTDPLHLGAGKRVLPEHVGLDDRELSLLGYEFHQGRPDFEPVVEAEPTQAPANVAFVAPLSSEIAPPNAAPSIGG